MVNPLWFWELPKAHQGIWAPVYSGFPDYAHGKFFFGRPDDKPIFWVRIR